MCTHFWNVDRLQDSEGYHTARCRVCGETRQLIGYNLANETFKRTPRVGQIHIDEVSEFLLGNRIRTRI